MKQFVVFSISIAVLFLAAPLLFAQGVCTPVYGGGLKEDGNPFCLEQVSAASTSNVADANAGAPQGQPTTTQKSGFVTPNDGLTKGGMTTQPAPAIKSQPSTGPELFGLAALIPAAFAGYSLRKKTSK